MLILLTVVLNANKLELPPEKMPDWWCELADIEQWEYFRQMSIEYVKLNEIINEKVIISNEQKDKIKASNEFLKKYNPYYPKWGVDVNFILLLDSSLTFDAILNINIKKYFLKGRFVICPGFDIKYYKRLLDQSIGIGGGPNFGFGFTF